MPRVSIVIPTYNSSKFILETLESVRAQTFQDFEILVVDDCSSDKTCELIESVDDDRISISRNAKNMGGPAAGVNSAMKLASGEFIALLDSDDLWTRHKLASQVALFDEVPEVGFCFTNYENFGAGGLPAGTGFDEHDGAMRRYPRRQILEDSFLIEVDSFLAELTRVQAAPISSAMMIRNSVIRKALPLDESNAFQDVQLTFRLANQTRFAYVDRVLMRRRVHDSNWSTVVSPLRWLNAHIVTLEALKRGPDLSDEENEAVKGMLSGYLKAAAYACFAEGKSAEARAFYARSLEYRLEYKPAIYWAATFLPTELIRILRLVKQRVQEMSRVH